MSKDVTNQDIIDAINVFADDTTKQLQDLKSSDVDLGAQLSQLTARVNSLPTKDYLDEKIGLLRADLVQHSRSERGSIHKLTSTLYRKKVLTEKEADAVLRLITV